MFIAIITGLPAIVSILYTAIWVLIVKENQKGLHYVSLKGMNLQSQRGAY